jgi:hypothetical protein
MRRVIVVAGLAMACIAGGVMAQEVRYVVRNGNHEARSVIVWKDEKAHQRGVSLVMNGVDKDHPEMIAGLVACVVPNDTRVMLEAPGLFSADVTVISGAHAGCQGNIASTDLQRAH